MTTSDTIRTTQESVGKDRVKLRVEMEESALKPALDAIYRRWARDMKVPGFRKGKVPRKIIDARVGPEVIREEALREALPDVYRQALRSEELEAIAPPDIEVVEFTEGTPIVFEATIDVRPDIQIPDLASLKVEAPPAEVTDDELEAQLDRLRDRFAELETVSRDLRRGDFALIDLKGYVHDEPLEGGTAPDYLYEVGSRQGPPKLDDELEGERAGAILKFNDILPEAFGELAGQEASFTVLVKEVKAKKLPPLDDEFAKTVGEFDTLDELKDDLRTRLTEVKAQMVEEEVRGQALQALLDAATLDPPEKLVESEFEHRLHHFEDDLKSAGISFGEYAERVQMTELEIRSEIRSEAVRAVTAELLLEQIARDAELEVSEQDIGQEIALAAARTNQDPRQVAEQAVEQGRLSAIAADVMRRKALDYVVEKADISGRRVEEETT
jgi:trigger factor